MINVEGRSFSHPPLISTRSGEMSSTAIRGVRNNLYVHIRSREDNISTWALHPHWLSFPSSEKEWDIFFFNYCPLYCIYIRVFLDILSSSRQYYTSKASIARLQTDFIRKIGLNLLRGIVYIYMCNCSTRPMGWILTSLCRINFARCFFAHLTTKVRTRVKLRLDFI